MKRRRRIRDSARGVFLAGLFSGSWGCDRYGDLPPASIDVPSREDFSRVSPVLEQHCGTLDCHGSPARNLRVYGVDGLRASGDDVTGGLATSELDVDATYRAIIELDPETVNRLVHGRAQVESWIVITKGRGLEEHVGGARLTQDSPADRCVVSWIRGSLDEDACNTDMFGPQPREGDSW